MDRSASRRVHSVARTDVTWAGSRFDGFGAREGRQRDSPELPAVDGGLEWRGRARDVRRVLVEAVVKGGAGWRVGVAWGAPQRLF